MSVHLSVRKATTDVQRRSRYGHYALTFVVYSKPTSTADAEWDSSETLCISVPQNSFTNPCFPSPSHARSEDKPRPGHDVRSDGRLSSWKEHHSKNLCGYGVLLLRQVTSGWSTSDDFPETVELNLELSPVSDHDHNSLTVP